LPVRVVAVMFHRNIDESLPAHRALCPRS
jgi:hypothetical protein